MDRQDHRRHRKPNLSKKRDTHFLCLPLVTKSSIPQLATSLSRFREVTTKQEDVTTTSKVHIIPEVAHRPPGTFHLTLGVMDLSDRARMQKALTLLKELDPTSILRALSQEKETEPDHDKDGDIPPSDTPTVSPLTISLKGLSAFSTTRSARVLYAKPSDPTARLQTFSLHVRQRFRDAGLITETRPLVLHATVANLRYAVQNRRGKRSRDEGEVDAREIVRIFDEFGGDAEGDGAGMEEFTWAEDIHVDRVAICKLGAVKSESKVLGLEYPPIAFGLI